MPQAHGSHAASSFDRRAEIRLYGASFFMTWGLSALRRFFGKLFLAPLVCGMISMPASAAAPDLVFAGRLLQQMKNAQAHVPVEPTTENGMLELASREPSSLPHFTIRTAPLPKAADMILVRKAAHILSLMKDGDIVRSFRVALGKNPVGHKVYEGDGRTPEGLYTIDARRAASNFHKALHISYPQEDDIGRARALGTKPGGAIMIHGLPNDVPEGFLNHPYEDWTDGCIAVTNAEMDEIWKMVSPGTPIVILP